MPRQSITFTPANDDGLKAQVESQEYSNKSDVVNDWIRKARYQHEELKQLRRKRMRAEQRGFSDRTPIQICKNSKTRLKTNSST